MATAVKRLLSASVSGRGVLVVATSGSTGTTIHTATSGSVLGTVDEIWLFAANHDTITRSLTIEFGGTTVPDDYIETTVASKTGLVMIVPGLILQNSKVVKAFSDVANMIIISGFVNSITD